MTTNQYLTGEEIQDAVGELGETGNWKVENDGFYTQREENAGWRYIGAVSDKSEALEFAESVVRD